MYKRLGKIVRYLVKGQDREDILHDTWLYFFNHPELCPPSFKLVKWRVLDLIRKRPPQMLELLATDAWTNDACVKDKGVDVNDVIKNAGLSNYEQELLYYRFVLDLSITDISKLLGVDRVRVSIECSLVMDKLRTEVL